ncbi:MAG: hypothetical protein J1E34_04285 [Oscillospiraceae bacterium]|nr:hypothetical protein [Oscillospiraceae bacterium]
MSVKNNKNKLKKTIYSGFADLSKDEIKNLIKKEVEKGPDAADADYIDFCFELLESKDGEGNEHKRTVYKPRKVLLVAAVVAVIAVISTMTVSANVFNISIPRMIYELFNGNSIDYRLKQADTSADGYALADTALVKELADNGIAPVTFPEYLTYLDCTVTSISYKHTLSYTSAIIALEYDGHRVDMIIDHYPDDGELDRIYAALNAKPVSIVSANGMDVFVFEHEDGYYIVRYRDNNTDYRIYFDFDLNTTLEFAASIK